MKETEDIVPASKILIDGDLSSARLISLLKLEIEEERLDYKADYNVIGSKRTKDKVELVRDIVGMANTYGGFIVLGVSEKVTSTGKIFYPDGMTEDARSNLDVSLLRQQVESYVSERLEIQYKIYSLDEYQGKTFGMIFVPPSDHSPIIFSKDGQYREKNEESNNDLTLFRSGDIVVRKGASTERADQSDMRRIISDIRSREKARWTDDVLGVRDLISKIDLLLGFMPQDAPVFTGVDRLIVNNSFEQLRDESFLYLSPDTVYEKISRAIEHGSVVSVRGYINKSPGMFFKHAEELNLDDENRILEVRDNHLLPILDSLLVIGVVCAENKQWDLLDAVQTAFYSICYQAEKLSTLALHRVVNKITIWQEVMVRVYALGGVLLRFSQWPQIQRLVQQEVEWDEYYRFHYWSRYILVMASRSGLLEKQGWIPSAIAYIERQKWMSYLFMSNKDQIVGSVCQFDFLQCVYTSIGPENEVDAVRAYPSFGLYYKSRTEPVVTKLIFSGPLRDTVISLSDTQLATLISNLDVYAGRIFVMFNGWEAAGWSDLRLQNFLKTNAN